MTLALPDYMWDWLVTAHNGEVYAKKLAPDEARRWMESGFALRSTNLDPLDDELRTLVEGVIRISQDDRKPLKEFLRGRLEYEGQIGFTYETCKRNRKVKTIKAVPHG